MTQSSDVAQFLARLKPSGWADDAWGRARMRMRMTSYVSDEFPPVALVTSVRAIVHQGDHVVALRNPDGVHVTPGGRLSPDESFEGALRREVLEETGLAIVAAHYIGFLHFHHLTPKPDDYRYPYPDFFHAMYAARATGTVRSGDADGWEEEAFLVPRDEAHRCIQHACIVPFLDIDPR
jgi:8-oxo-dGTP pyrophosphatase MutT (NUDIX family)